MTADTTTARELRYFAHDASGGVTDFFATEDEAIEFAKEGVQTATETANDDGEWAEGSDQIYVGIVTHRAFLNECEGGTWEMSFGLIPSPAPAPPSAATPEDDDPRIGFLLRGANDALRARDAAIARATAAEAALAAVTAERDRVREALEDIDRWARAACLRSGAYATNSDAMTNDQADFYNIAERSGAALSAKEATDER